MPQIAKVRIVNFQYNNGKRIIADELYDFENKGVPSDVLINLVNGGGKSVLVQLMMQPIIPKAKVAGRRMESFFTKATDHCYVLLEWAPDDGGKMKLLTGIAMAASDSSEDSDSDRGFQIKYYTFMSSYSDDQEEYSIAALPLSKKENKRYVPAPFDFVRNLAKRSNGKLQRYSGEDGAIWRDALSQYGIVQNEWRMTEKLNSNEDGMSKFFSGLKTSDALIDALIIPRIEEKQNHFASKDDSSLETMLVSYAKEYGARRDVIKERDNCKGFFDKLREAKTEAEALRKSNDSLNDCIGNLFAYSDALEDAISSKKQEVMRLDAEAETQNEKKRHIRWEKASADYHSCKEAFEKESDKLKTAELARDEAENSWEEAKRKLLLTECAHYYEQLVETDGKIKSITTEIESREHNTESGQKLAALKYSALRAIEEERESVLPEIEKLSGCIEELKDSINILDKELFDIGKKVSDAKSEADKSEAILDKQKLDDDGIIAKLNIDASRMLDDKYREEDLKEWETRSLDHIKSVELDIQSLDKETRGLEKRRGDIPQEIADIRNEIKAAKSNAESSEKEIREYLDAEKAVKVICDKYNLDFGLRFANHVQDYLAERLMAANADIKAAAKEKEAAEELLSAMDRGSLHIPKRLTDYLDGTGCRYTTFESYVLEQRKKGFLSEEEERNLLSRYPYAVYGVMVNESDMDIFLKEAEDTWLPALLPVFTPEETDHMLHGTLDSFHAIAAYARDYFFNGNEYIAKRRAIVSEQTERLDLLAKRVEAFRTDGAAAEAFSVYDSNWLSSKRAAEEEYKNEISEKTAEINRLQKERNDAEKRISEILETIEQRKEDLFARKNDMNVFAGFMESLKEEDRLRRNLWDKREKLRIIRKKESEKEALKKTRVDELGDSERKLKELKYRAEHLNEGLSYVEGAEEAEILAGEWASLLEQYKSLSEIQGAELKALNDEKARLLKQREDKEKEIQKRRCSQEEYAQIVYSEERESDLRETADLFEKTCREKGDAYSKANREQGIAGDRYGRSRSRLDEFGGEPLPENEVGKFFDERIADVDSLLSDLSVKSKHCLAKERRLERIQGKTENFSETYTRPAEYGKIVLEADCEAQRSALFKAMRECEDTVDAGFDKVKSLLNEMFVAHGTSSADIGRAIGSMQALLLNEKFRGDKYRTLCEHIESNMHVVELKISGIDTDLTEFRKTRDDLIRQCLIQGRQMYEGLMRLSSNSKVNVQGKRRPMLRFDIPEAIDENVANASISAEIDKGTSELAVKLSEDGHSESEIGKIASRTVGSKRLLRKYIGSENIILKAYKIDRNPDNSGYRTWEQTQVNNSGAEKFVVYFAVILALMAYVRDSDNDIGSKRNRSVLILDNPFGPISSKHVLEPMFEISRNYNVQMICLSDIGKSDIVSCFDLVIRAVVRQFALSTKEQLTHEGNERIEHGFYKSEQLSLF